MLTLAVALGGCGGDDGDGGAAGGTEKVLAKQGGSLTHLWAADIDYLDPGVAYYQASYDVQFAVNRRLYSHQPDGNVVPDVADGEPEISEDQRAITIKIKPGVKEHGLPPGVPGLDQDPAGQR